MTERIPENVDFWWQVPLTGCFFYKIFIFNQGFDYSTSLILLVGTSTFAVLLEVAGHLVPCDFKRRISMGWTVGEILGC